MQRLARCLTAGLIGLAAFAAADAQALPAGVHCVAATAANEVTPPPPLWELKHEPQPAHLPPPLCPAHQVPTSAPGAAGTPSAVAPIVAEPKGLREPVALEPLATLAPLGTLGPRRAAEPPKPREGYPSAPYYYAGDGWYTTETYTGNSVAIEVTNPKVSETPGVHSLGQLAAAKEGNVEKTVETGWHRDPAFGGGSRYFTYINKDKYKSNGEPGGDCYNCATAVTGAAYTQNQELTVGHTYQFSAAYFSGDWWFGVGSGWVAYEPGSFWSGTFTTSTYNIWFGEVDDKTGPNSQMGTGTIGTKTGSAIMNNPYVYGKKGELILTAGHANQEKDPYPSDLPAYDVGLYSANEREWHWGGE
jgi:hypothetical protein